MKFKATDEQVKQIAINAIMASSPMGLGFIQYNPSLKLETKNIAIANNLVNIDYFQGRMVKLFMKLENGWWHVDEHRVHPEYQSWVSKYPTMLDLIASVPGIGEIKE